MVWKTKKQKQLLYLKVVVEADEEIVAIDERFEDLVDAVPVLHEWTEQLSKREATSDAVHSARKPSLVWSLGRHFRASEIFQPKT